MKNQVLSIEQMQRLKELGVDTSKASMACLFQDGESNIYDWDEVVEECSEFGDCFQYFVKNDEGNHNKVYMSLLDAEGGNYDHSYREDCAVFTLQDVIDLLPKSILINSVKHWICVSPNCLLTEFQIMYVDGDYCHAVMKQDKSLLQAAYNMLVWVAENGYLTSK